jgi:glutathione S-transferase
MFDSRIKLVSVAGAADLKAVAKDRLNWLSAMLEGRTFICGERLSLADLLLFGFLKFGAEVGQDLTNETAWAKAWYDRINARPSASA